MEFSIIIPYWNKLYEIQLILKALTLQDFPKDQFEIVIINDGCDDEIENVVNKFQSGLIIHYYYKKHTGNRSRNRNLGAERSKGKRLIFLDNDMIPSKNMLFEFNLALKYLQVGGILVSDDVTWNNAYRNFCKKIGKRQIVTENSMGFVRKTEKFY